MGYQSINRAFRSHAADRAQFRRTAPKNWSQTADGLSALTSSGLTTSGNYIAASVGGTDGSAILPVWSNRRDFRASFKVKATKSTAGSKAVVGFTNSAINSLPTGTAPGSAAVFAAGYLQGSGIVIVRENVGTPVVVVADASLVDGAEYLVNVWSDQTLNTKGGSTTGILSVRVQDSAGAEVAKGSTTFTLSFYFANNAVIRTNVAAGALSDVRITLHPLGGVGVPSAGTFAAAVGPSGISPFVRIPANPNGALILALHGHGSNPTDLAWTQTAYTATWLALEKAGFTIAFVNTGVSSWGNDDAMATIVNVYNQMVNEYDIDPERVFLYGTSMGAGASATAIAKRLIPVKAAYLAQPAVNFEWVAAQPSFSTILSAYASTAARDKNDPMKQPAAAYAGVPLLITASAGDTAVNKTQNADAFVTKVSGSTFVRAVTVTGDHNNAAHFIADAAVAWFKSYA